VNIHPPAPPRIDDEASLAARAAWLYFVGGLTQSQIADRLHVQSSKAHRLIARANRDGMIRVFIEGPVAECVALEERICARWGLSLCQVTPEVSAEPMPTKELGLAGASFLRNLLERGEHSVIGIGHGRTLAACIDVMPHTPVRGTRFVSLLGGLTRRFAANPFDVIHRIAERTGAEAYVMPVPFYANTPEDRAVLLAQKGLSDVLQLAREATLYFVGIGRPDHDASIVTSGLVERREIEEARKAGACGEVLGYFLDAKGRPVDTEITARTLSVPFAELGARQTVAVAGGRDKVRAIRSVLESGCLSGLITDEATARELIGPTSGS
jgi:DNA-binding transcriptional regulator LsrR (DeoR family)